MIQIIYSALRQKGIWLCSDFEVSLFQSGQWWKKRLIAAMYIFFRIVSNVEAKVLPDIHELLSICPLHCEYEPTFYKGLIKARVYRKLIESVGVESES
jgi:hypothetical protein